MTIWAEYLDFNAPTAPSPPFSMLQGSLVCFDFTCSLKKCYQKSNRLPLFDIVFASIVLIAIGFTIIGILESLKIQKEASQIP